MKKIGLTLFTIATLGASTIGISMAQAAPAASGQLASEAHGLSLIEKTQFFYGKREYCWYDNGWNGPGWYWCGYDLRQGFGWGGPVGWHNWDRRHPPRPIIHGPVHGPGSSHNPRPAPKPRPVPNPFSYGRPPWCGLNAGKPGCPLSSGHGPPPKNLNGGHAPGSGTVPPGSGGPNGHE